MSGIMDKLHRHKTPATTTTAPFVTSQAAGGPILTSSTGLAQQGPALYTPSTLKTSGGILNTGSTNILNTTTPLTTSTTTVQQPIQHATTHVSAPIIQETVRNDRVVEVQPVLHREVDQNIVHHIEKHYTEAAPSQGGIVERQPIVQQAVHTNVVNEIQPIIHRERVVPVVERSEQHLSQHIVQPTIHTHEVIYERGSFMQQGQTLVGSGGIQQQGLQGQTLVGSGGFQQGLQGQNLVGSGGLQQQQFLNQGSWAHQNYGQSYQGLSFPYTNAAAHPNYGYQRLPRDRKAERFELKAAEWERRGNLRKAQKNRDKALRLRQKSQPGYVAPARPQSYYTDRVGMFDQKALQYQQWGMQPQSQRYQQRASRMRSKYNLPASNLYTTQQQGGLLQPSSLYTQQQNYYQQQPWQGGLLQQGLQGQNLGLQQGLQGQNFGLQQGQNLGFQQGLQGQSLGLQQQGLQGQNLGLQQGLQGQNLQQGGALQQGLQGGLQGMQQGTGFTQGFQQGATRGLQQQGLQQQGLQQQGLQQQGLQQGLQQNQPGSAWTLQGLPQEKILQQQQLNQPNQFTSAR